MALARKSIISMARRDVLINNFQPKLLLRFYSSSASSPLVATLLQQPNSRIKAVLDSEDNNLTFKSFGFSWSAFLSVLISSSSQKAVPVLEWRLEQLLKQNERSHDCYSELISLCGKIQNIKLAVQIFTSMEAHGLKPSSSTFNALISVCLSSGNMTMALSLFETMEKSNAYKPNSDTYNALISAYAKFGNDNAMKACYAAKKAAEFSSDLQTYESLIVGCIKSKQFVEADKFYEEMVLKGIMPNIKILQSLLVGLLERRNMDEVKMFLKLIINGGWDINEDMAGKLVGFYYDHGKVNEMEDLLVALKKSGQSKEVLLQVHCGIIRKHASWDSLDEVEYCVGRMVREGMCFRCAGDVEKIICSYFRGGSYERLELFLECIKGCYKLTRSTYDLLVSGFRRAGLYEKVDSVINDMKMDGFL